MDLNTLDHEVLSSSCIQHIENISSRTGGRYVSSPSAFYILRVYVKTRPSVNYAKDWMDHSFVFPCLVWSGKGFHFGCDHQGGESTNIFLKTTWCQLVHSFIDQDSVQMAH